MVEKAKKQAYKSVVQLFRNETKEWYHVRINDEEIICTGGHPFYILNAEANRKSVLYEGTKTDTKGKWITTKELKVSDQVLLSDGSCAIIEEIQVEKLSEPEITYNFEVADYHTYYVSESNVLVHNACTVESADDGLQFQSREKLEAHFAEHGDEFGGLYKTADEYLAGANYVIKNGVYVPEMNGYIRFFGAGGKANYAFVGLTQGGKNITTFGIRSVDKLIERGVSWLLK